MIGLTVNVCNSKAIESRRKGEKVILRKQRLEWGYSGSKKAKIHVYSLFLVSLQQIMYYA